ncbi:MAG TPA: MOSC domain-containing protein [Amycolatopsis sp.]|uniref:MOSC domain-containing protein n=1 Tax=Amycolatopsis sp. TaxID=37632 RepID=UPI002B474F2D|nr:MOSC domain-containing protein [Amycolatopsis sp.]HKS43509.1 MOSC domain-containing protein [Amycolatopsis sp.]
MRREIGRVAGLWRYPVKSNGRRAARGGLAVLARPGRGPALGLRPRGKVRSGFPWLTIRQRNDLWHYEPFFSTPEKPDTSAVLVRSPSGEVHDVTDPELAAELGDVRVRKQDRGIFDTSPLSLITTNSVGSLDVRRFRPNLLVETESAEESWIGYVLRIKDLRLRVDRRDRRCVIVNIDPDTARRDPSVLRAIAREHDMCLGVHGSTMAPGHVRLGDPVVVEAT